MTRRRRKGAEKAHRRLAQGAAVGAVADVAVGAAMGSGRGDRRGGLWPWREAVAAAGGLASYSRGGRPAWLRMRGAAWWIQPRQKRLTVSFLVEGPREKQHDDDEPHPRGAADDDRHRLPRRRPGRTAAATAAATAATAAAGGDGGAAGVVGEVALVEVDLGGGGAAALDLGLLGGLGDAGGAVGDGEVALALGHGGDAGGGGGVVAGGAAAGHGALQVGQDGVPPHLEPAAAAGGGAGLVEHFHAGDGGEGGDLVERVAPAELYPRRDGRAAEPGPHGRDPAHAGGALGRPEVAPALEQPEQPRLPVGRRHRRLVEPGRRGPRHQRTAQRAQCLLPREHPVPRRREGLRRAPLVHQLEQVRRRRRRRRRQQYQHEQRRAAAFSRRKSLSSGESPLFFVYSHVPLFFVCEVFLPSERVSDWAMAEDSLQAAPPVEEKMKATAKRKRKKKQAGEGKQLLGWRKSVRPEEDAFALFSGEEGGFLSLEEIDASEYGAIGELPQEIVIEQSKKRKRASDDPVVEDGEKSKKTTKKKKPRKKTKQKMTMTAAGNQDVHQGDVSGECSEVTYLEGDSNAESVLQNDDYRAWKKMKLHPLLMKSIRKLGFKEPTPIQKACIPVAAHQGKDVIGAAETGSGKTLAFGLPILQRILKDRERAKSSSGEDQEGRGGLLRALVVAPTRELSLQVSDHLKKMASLTSIRVISIVGGMSSEKQERLLKSRPEIVVGTPGRLWDLMSGGDKHLTELSSLSFFVLDEADRMVESGHFNELQSIIDMLPASDDESGGKKRQTFVFSATIALSNNFRRKLKRGFQKAKATSSENLSSIERLSERAGMSPDVEIVDLTNAAILANKLEESFIECNEDNKEAHLYYILSVHGRGRTIVFCTSIAALRRISSLLRILGLKMWTLHAQMQQRARLKAIDRFRDSENGVLVATDVAARGLDIPGVRTVIHFQLPHSADVYIHRSGRTARASADGCSIALISPPDRTKFFSLCKSLSKESLRKFPLVDSYMLNVTKRLSLARQIDKMTRVNSRENATKSWLRRSAEAVELDFDDSASEEENVKSHRKRKVDSAQLQKLQQELDSLLEKPLEPRTLSHRYLAGAGLNPFLQEQLMELSKKRGEQEGPKGNSRSRFVVIGQDSVEPLKALQSSGQEICVDSGKWKETRKLQEDWRRKKRDQKRRERDQRRKKSKMKGNK
ncbi:P-loop containing nucleoside triphosphate hydrolases superfamily protein [Wolffia australiana]